MKLFQGSSIMMHSNYSKSVASLSWSGDGRSQRNSK